MGANEALEVIPMPPECRVYSSGKTLSYVNSTKLIQLIGMCLLHWEKKLYIYYTNYIWRNNKRWHS